MKASEISRYRDDEGRFVIGTTIIKQFSREDVCPAKLKALYVDDIAERTPTSSMQKGNFFETLCIGSCADGSKVIDLPRQKSKDKETGEYKKYVDQIRIEYQVEVFKQVMEAYNFEIQNAQMKLLEPIDEFLALGTTIDILTEDQGSTLIIDLKLTKDVNSTWGDFCWGTPELMDHSQPILISWLWEQLYGEKPRFIYAVFDYKDSSDYKLIEKIVTVTDYMELEEKIRRILVSIRGYYKNGWDKIPSYANCHNCPLNTVCDKQITIKPIEII